MSLATDVTSSKGTILCLKHLSGGVIIIISDVDRYVIIKKFFLPHFSPIGCKLTVPETWLSIQGLSFRKVAYSSDDVTTKIL
jgi:hypothetical protein